MFDEDTIAGLSSASGNSPRAIIRVSGQDAPRIVKQFFKSELAVEFQKGYSRYEGEVYLKDMCIPSSLYVMKSPYSYTREDVAEFHYFGNRFVGEQFLKEIFDQGVRHAEPGEFTKRAFLNGRIDLTQAEAVMQIIRARNDAESRAACMAMSGGFSEKISDITRQLTLLLADLEAGLDFEEEDIAFVTSDQMNDNIKKSLERIKEFLDSPVSKMIAETGVRAAFIGPTNAGKSSLFNKIIESENALVSDEEGTTRDYLKANKNIDGIDFILIDSAGEMQADDHDDPLKLALGKTANIYEWADLILWTVDASDSKYQAPRETFGKPVIVLLNKADQGIKLDLPENAKKDFEAVVNISAKTGEGIEGLLNHMVSVVRAGHLELSGSEFFLTERHTKTLKTASGYLEKALENLGKVPDEVLAEELRFAMNSLFEITGESYTEELLDHIFSNFCIGK